MCIVYLYALLVYLYKENQNIIVLNKDLLIVLYYNRVFASNVSQMHKQTQNQIPVTQSENCIFLCILIRVRASVYFTTEISIPPPPLIHILGRGISSPLMHQPRITTKPKHESINELKFEHRARSKSRKGERHV